MFIEDTNRKIIPRWRDFTTTAALGELASHERQNGSAGALQRAPSFEAICAAWTVNRTLWHALDLVSAARVVEVTDAREVKEAAAFILGNQANSPDAGVAIARGILEPSDEAPASDVSEVTTAQLYGEIHSQRRRLRVDPRNSVAWVDLARLYTIAGQHEKAMNAIEVAYKQRPENRFVLRSASRFFVHVGEHDHALRILRSSDVVSVDPWLAAAEIGVSAFAGKSTRLVKPAKILLADTNISSFMGSELASALGTLELEGGNNKLAKRLFQLSLAAPTENSLAQAEWATRQIPGLDVEAFANRPPRDFEAKAIHGFRSGEWDLVRDSTIRWFQDQPFSSRPAGLLSYIYSEIYDNYADAEKVLNLSLKSNPGDRLLTNNLIYVLINLGRLDEADRLLADVDPGAVDDESSLTLVATLGLFLFRKGDFERGSDLYRKAIELARHKRLVRYEALAAIHLARESISAGLAKSETTLGEAREIAQRVPDADVTFLLTKVEDFFKTRSV